MAIPQDCTYGEQVPPSINPLQIIIVRCSAVVVGCDLPIIDRRPRICKFHVRRIADPGSFKTIEACCIRNLDHRGKCAYGEEFVPRNIEELSDFEHSGEVLHNS